MRKEAVKVTPGEIIPPGPQAAPAAAAKPKPRAKASTPRAKAAKAPVAAVAVAAAGPAPAPAPAAAPAAEGPDPAATRRNFFRLDIFDVQVRFTVEEIAEQDAKPVQVRGSLGDVSAGGLRLIAEMDAGAMPDWPVGAGVIGRLQFSLLEDEPGFDLPGRLVRRVETTSGFELAFSWNDPPQPEIDRLVHSLYQLEVRRRAAMPDAKGGRKPQKSAQAQAGARSRPPLLLGAAIGLAASIAVYESVAGAAVAPVLGVAAVVCAAAYLLVSA